MTDFERLMVLIFTAEMQCPEAQEYLSPEDLAYIDRIADLVSADMSATQTVVEAQNFISKMLDELKESYPE